MTLDQIREGKQSKVRKVLVPTKITKIGKWEEVCYRRKYIKPDNGCRLFILSCSRCDKH